MTLTVKGLIDWIVAEQIDVETEIWCRTDIGPAPMEIGDFRLLTLPASAVEPFEDPGVEVADRAVICIAAET